MPVRLLGDAQLGASAFFASSHPSESCGSNGLPLTPNSIKILGRYQILKTITHRNLCKYVAIKRGKQERIVVVTEHYKLNLRQAIRNQLLTRPESVLNVVHQVCQGLAHQNAYGMVHRCLSPENILFDGNLNVKLAQYGLYHMTNYGACVSFPIGTLKYLSPEVLAAGHAPSDHSTPTHPNVDTWALGIILLEMFLGIDLYSILSLEELVKKILNFSTFDNSLLIVNEIVKDHNVNKKFEEVDKSLIYVIEQCLIISPISRPSPKDIIHLPVLQSENFDFNSINPIRDSFPSIHLTCADLEMPNFAFEDIIEMDHLAERPIDEVYYLWELAGGDLDGELKRFGMLKAKPPICSLPNVVVEEGEMFGQKKDHALLLDDTVVILSLEQLRQRLKKIPPEAFYPLTESRVTNIPNTHSISDLAETARLPLIIKEKDIEYQFHRIVLYQRLLAGYPFKRHHICKEAKVDITPLYRNLIWAALLEIEGDVLRTYDMIDKETLTVTDRQIEVDIPRCHQYDELLSSPEGHKAFKRILKAWVVNNEDYVYWQGLDSLCAPFLYLNFTDEALAYACFSSFIDKYLYKFFLKDNSPVIQEYLAVFSHLISFHDPELQIHLNSIGFIPELYAIPWFLTMFTHVFPLHKIFHLWDTLLLGNPSFPLCVGVAILQQLRDSLLSFGFNECILLFSDMPEIDIEKCVQDSIKIFCCIPKSATYRQYERPQNQMNGDSKFGLEKHSPELDMDPIPFDLLKSELCPHISAADLLDLFDMAQNSMRIKPSKSKPKHIVVDVRSSEEFLRGAIPESINIPFYSAFTSEGSLVFCPEVTTLYNNRGRLIVVVGNRGSNASNFADQLVHLRFPRVCLLHKGIDALRHTGILVVPAAEVRLT